MASHKVETRTRTEERLSCLEMAVAKLTETVIKLEAAISTETLETKSAREALKLDMDGRLEEFDRNVKDLSGRIEACVLRFDDMDRQWPVVGRDATKNLGQKDKTTNKTETGTVGLRQGPKVTPTAPVGVTSRTKSQIDSDGHRQEAKGKILVVGDSLARGVGYKMTSMYGDSVKVDAVGGAKIKDVVGRVNEVTPDKTSTLVVIAGANNMQEDYSETIEEGVQDLIAAGSKVAKDILVVGLVKRYDLGPGFERKRILLNMRIKARCKDAGAKFIEYEPERSRLHKDGLHLNWRGQNELGKAILSKCKPRGRQSRRRHLDVLAVAGGVV